MRENLKKEFLMDMEYIIMKMEIYYIKENLKMIYLMDMEYFILKMEVNMKDNIKMD